MHLLKRVRRTDLMVAFPVNAYKPIVMDFHPPLREVDTSSLESVCLSAARCPDSEYQVCVILNAALSLTKHILSRRPTG